MCTATKARLHPYLSRSSLLGGFTSPKKRSADVAPLLTAAAPTVDLLSTTVQSSRSIETYFNVRMPPALDLKF